MEFPPKYFRFFGYKDARGWGEAFTQPFRLFGYMDPVRGWDDTSNQSSQTLVVGTLAQVWLLPEYMG